MANAHSAAAPVPHMAIDFLGKKIKVETEDWDELKWGEHAHAFTVAHSSGAGVLDTIFELMNKAQAEGIAFSEFRNGMLDEMKAKGWYGGAGHTEKEKKYINWRIGVIYDTNMRTAYAQAEYREQLQGAHLRPIWVYQSQLAGKNRRQEHIELHGRAFRYDDSFWDTYYPPNGWGCECYVSTESEHSAEKGGITVEESKNITLPEIDPTWAYNVGREALAPNFSKYTNLRNDAKEKIYTAYHKSMNGNRLSEGEAKTLLKRVNEKDFKPLQIQYHVGTLEAKRYEALREIGVQDCKVLATDSTLRHGTGGKNTGQKVPENLLGDVYKTFGEPDYIYEERVKDKLYRVFHFVKNVSDEKKIKVLIHLRNLQDNQTALEIRTIGHAEYKYNDGKYKKIW